MAAKKQAGSGHRRAAPQGRQSPEALRASVRYTRQWQALRAMGDLMRQLAASQHGRPSAPSERMIGSMLFARSANLLASFEMLLKSRYMLDAATLLRPLYENAADACLIAFHETRSANSWAERLIAYQPIADHHRAMRLLKDAGDTLSPAYITAQRAVADFERAHGSSANKDNWSGLQLRTKSEYLARAFDTLPTAQQELITKVARPYLDEFVHGGPIMWQIMIGQSEHVIDSKLGPHDSPEVMAFAVPVAVTLIAATARAVLVLWDRPELFSLLAQAFGDAASRLEPAASPAT